MRIKNYPHIHYMRIKDYANNNFDGIMPNINFSFIHDTPCMIQSPVIKRVIHFLVMTDVCN